MIFKTKETPLILFDMDVGDITYQESCREIWNRHKNNL